MAVRATARRFGRDVQCNSAFVNTMPIADMPLQRAVGNLGGDDRRRAVMAWLTRSGPFWEDVRWHGEDDYLECDGDVVTDTSVGEAGFRTLHGVACGLISLAPSEWCRAPLRVTWVSETGGHGRRSAEVGNWWQPEVLEAELKRKARPVSSWDDLRDTSVAGARASRSRRTVSLRFPACHLLGVRLPDLSPCSTSSTGWRGHLTRPVSVVPKVIASSETSSPETVRFSRTHR